MTLFTEISVATDGEAAEAVAEVLRPFAYQEGVVLEQLGDAENLDPEAVDPTITVKIYVPQDEDTPAFRQRLEEILYHLNRLYPIPSPSYKVLQETDWANAWKEHYHPFRVGKRIWVRPTWYDVENVSDQKGEPVQEDDIILVLDPGMAFGTGLHPTTQSCLRALENVIRTGDRVLDVGTGSGILAIAALKLGADYVLGVDTDEMAVKTAATNGEQNQVDKRFAVRQGELSSVSEEGWDVVLVNILAPVITGLLLENRLMDYVTTSGWLILSGIIDTQVAKVEAVVRTAGGRICEKFIVRDWQTLVVQHSRALFDS